MATFEKTQGIVDFFKAQGAKELNIVTWNKSGKRGVGTDNGMVIPMSNEIQELTGDLKVSWFVPEDAEPFWMVHKAGGGYTATGPGFAL
jgi:hypothetical protein